MIGNEQEGHGHKRKKDRLWEWMFWAADRDREGVWGKTDSKIKMLGDRKRDKGWRRKGSGKSRSTIDRKRGEKVRRRKQEGDKV